ncbi:MAG: tRNA (N6-isopentenyl adenosine(37)-C2)-methylthiotransferase MiaB [Opitutales bacterium]
MEKLRVHIRTYGCQMNERDSENVAAQFKARGYIVTDDEYSADAIFVNTCSVRESAELKAAGKLGYIVARKKKSDKGYPITGVFGCMVQNLGKGLIKKIPKLDIVAGTWHTPYLVDYLEEFLANGKRIVRLGEDETSHEKINMHLPENNNTVKYVSIMQGCSMKCSYCIVPYTRGRERSRPMDDIILEIENLAKGGTKEICLLGQVVNAYGRGMPIIDGISPFVQLLRRINAIEGIERIRFTSPHPSFFRDDLINSYGELEKLCEYVHLPMQSGSPEVLKRMKRPYQAERFKEIADALRARVPNMSISTDIIVGFPKETEEDFQKTVELFKYCNFDMAYIFKYSPRKGTPSAEELDDIPEAEKERRNQILLDILQTQSVDFNEKLLGTTQEVLFEAPAKRGDGVCVGRTRTHRKVFAKLDPSRIGTLVNIRIETASVSAMTGIVGA